MRKIIVPAEQVWGYFKKHFAELKKDMHLIAEAPEYGVEIYLSSDASMPVITVSADDCSYAEVSPVCETQCMREVAEIYDKYLSLKFLEEIITEEEDSTEKLTEKDMIDERESELDDAFFNLVDVVLEESGTAALGAAAFEEICLDLKEHTLEYLARKHELTIRRPMYLEDEETKEDFFEEYPYDCMVFEDEDNPVYKNA